MRLFVGLLAIVAIGVAGCGDSSVDLENSTRARTRQLVVPGPIVITGGQEASKGDQRLFAKVPAEVRPHHPPTVIAPSTALKRKYWAANWAGPDGRGSNFCLYSMGSNDPGPIAECFENQTFQRGRAFSYGIEGERFELLVFNPDPKGSVRVLVSSKWHEMTSDQDVFGGSFGAMPEELMLFIRGKSHRIKLG